MKKSLAVIALAALLVGCSSNQQALQVDYRNARTAAKQGDFKAEAADMTPLVQADSQDPNAYVSRAYAYFNAGENNQAIDDLTRAIDLEPQASEYLILRAMFYTRTGRFDLALDDANSAVDLSPHTADVYSGRGFVYMASGDSAKAIADLRRAIKSDPNVALFHLQLGFAYGMQHRYPDTIGEWETAISLRPNYGPAYSAIGWLQATCPDSTFRNTAKAVENAKRGAQLGAPKIMAGIAAVSASPSSRTKATHYDPGLAWSLDALAAAYAAAGNFEQAVTIQQQAIAHNRGAPNPLATREKELLTLYQQKKAYNGDLNSIVPQLPWIVVPS